MVKFGCCLPGASFVPQASSTVSAQADPVTQLVNGIEMLAAYGYDFAELTVGTLTQLSEDDFRKIKEAIQNAPIPVPVCNSFIPPHIKLTGPDVDYDAVNNYLRLAMSRVREVGGQTIIFGSGGARSYPNGFSREEALSQIKKFLQICSRHALEQGITIAIEPLNKKESNVINTVQEALDLARDLKLPNIGVLADTYHMHEEQESANVLPDAVHAGLLAHVHIADRDRIFPGLSVQDGVDFAEWFRILYSTGYAGGVSAECRFDSFAETSKKSLDYVKQLWTALH